MAFHEFPSSTENDTDDHKSFTINSSHTECTIDISLALTLYVSRIFGVAPVTLKKKQNSIIVSVSPAMCAYSYLLLFALHAILISGLFIDFYLDSSRSVRVRSATSSLAWISEVLIVGAVTTVAIYHGPERMKSTMHCLKVIEKVNSRLYNHIPENGVKQISLIIGILYLLSSISLYLFDFYAYFLEALDDGKDIKVLCMYLSFYVEMLATFPLELQFMNIVIKIVTAQKAVNNALMDLVRQIDTRENHNFTTNVLDSDYSSDNANFRPREDNYRIKESAFLNVKKDTELVHCLMLSYGAICDVVRQIKDSNAIVLVLLVLSFLLHMVVIPYYWIIFGASTMQHQKAGAVLQILMCTFHTLNMIIIVEPAHRSTEETEQTQALLGQLTRRVPSSAESLIHELDLFCKQIDLNPVSFTLLGICPLARPIIVTIFGGVTTYLVIILQCRALDKRTW